jgi:hypothetical protein
MILTKNSCCAIFKAAPIATDSKFPPSYIGFNPANFKCVQHPHWPSNHVTDQDLRPGRLGSWRNKFVLPPTSMWSILQ